MNDSLTIFLYLDDVRAVRCQFDPDVKGEEFRVFKTVDHTLKVDDYVIVETGTRHGMTVVRVKEVDYDPDLDSTKIVRWVIGKVDRRAFDRALVREQELVSEAKAAQRRKKKAELQDALNGDVEQLKALALQVSDSTVSPPPDPAKTRPAPDVVDGNPS